MKKIIIAALMLVVLLPTMTFAATGTNPRDLYQKVVGEEAPSGMKLWEAAEAAGKGEAFFAAMKQARIDANLERVKEGILTQEEADFLNAKFKDESYADMQKMQAIREKLRAAGIKGQGFGMGKGQAEGRPGKAPGMRNNCPMVETPAEGQ